MYGNTSKQLIESLETKWGKILDHGDMSPIKGKLQRGVTAVLLENQHQATRNQGGGMALNEDVHTNYSGNLGSGTNIGSYDPVLIGLVRRSAPNLLAYDVAGVQPMTGPTGLVFALRAKYQGGSDEDLTDDTEALFDEADTAFSGAGSDGTVGTAASGDNAGNPSVLNDSPAGAFKTGKGMSTVEGEALGTGGDAADFNEMGITIDKIQVTAVTRGLKAEYTDELQQDLRAVHGLDAASELAQILQQEILAEINREVVRQIYITAEKGAASGTTTAGVFDLDTDSNGRWLAERFKGLVFQIERDANAIAKRTRRGKGNIMITTSDVASALAMAGVLDYAPAMESNLQVDDTGNLFAGVLRNGGIKVYIDPYATGDWYVVGYKGTGTPYDAGLFYCPYIPLQMMQAVGENSFQPKMAFKTRYGMVSNPFANSSGNMGALVANANKYYRRCKVANLT